MGFELVSRGYAKIYLYYSREFGFFVFALEKVFTFRADWHQDDQAKLLVAHYHLALEAALEAHLELQPCVTHCAHCGIRFLTHPRNAGRRNLRCPFGCREHLCRQHSGQRSTAYYQTVSGKRKKQRLNRRRESAFAECPTVAESHPPLPSAPDVPAEAPTDAPAELHLDGAVLDEASLTKSPVLPYLRMLLSLIEGVRFSAAELLFRLRQGLRQHSICSRKRRDYVVRFLRQHPP